MFNRRNIGLALGMLMAVGLTAGALITSTHQAGISGVEIVEPVSSSRSGAY